jgi:diguanylate cyclase (GGDEF)-like protein
VQSFLNHHINPTLPQEAMKASNVLTQLFGSLTPSNNHSSQYDKNNNLLQIISNATGGGNTNTPSPKNNQSPLVEFKPIYFSQAVKSLEVLNAAIVVFNIDRCGNITPEYESPNLQNFLQISKSRNVSSDMWIKNIHAHDFSELLTPSLEKIYRTNKPHQFTYRYLSDSGLLWIQAHFMPEKIGNDEVQIFAVLQDVTLQKQQKNKHDRSQILNKSIAQNTSFVVYTYDIYNDSYDFVEDSVYKIIPDSISQIPTNNSELEQFIHPDDITAFKDYRSKLLLKKEYDYFNGESITIRFKKDLKQWSKIKVSETIAFNQETNQHLIHGVMEDLSEIESLENQLYQQTQFDNLTKLPNRTMFIKHTTDKLNEFHNHTIKSLSLLFIDINRFKVINDSLGYANGDILLRKISTRLRSIIDENIYLSRLGVDEFALLVENFENPNEITSLSLRLIDQLSKPFEIEGIEVHTSPSIGICIADENHATAENLIGNADAAKHRAKKQKGGGYAIFENDMKQLTYTRFVLEADMRNAIKNNEFELYFQPQYSLSDDTVFGCEALVRWNNPTRGLVSPGKFIPIAEENGMIIEIDTWIINQACRTLRQWNDKGIECNMSVNMSSRFFNEGDPVTMISDALKESGAQPNQLEIEITEGAIMNDLETAKKVIDQLQDLGVQVAIDDFGTGYSSLAYLKELNINTLKIDGKFVTDLVSDTNSQAIIRSIINLAQLLDMKTVAECVETLDQVNYLKEQDCDLIQGFLISKPLESKKLMKFFNNTNFSLQKM